MTSLYYSNIKDRLIENAVFHPLSHQSRIVIFSDLHMGDGRSHDDFVRNSDLFISILRDYYFDRDFTLILNGDVEELQKFQLPRVQKRWRDVYLLFDQFHRQGRLFKIAGNHDFKLLTFAPAAEFSYPLLESVRLGYHGQDLLVFHGHQMSAAYEQFNAFIGVMLRFVANTLRIRNRSTAHSSHRRWKIESRTYDFSRKHKMISIIGHTHRPLFESMAKTDVLRYEIENLCRLYASGEFRGHADVEKRIFELKGELTDILENGHEEGFVSQLYSSNFLIPCLFNSGSVIGKRGVTGLEIEGDEISLVHWQRENTPARYSQKGEDFQTPLRNNPEIQRRVTKQDDLRYIFSRIRLLG